MPARTLSRQDPAGRVMATRSPHSDIDDDDSEPIILDHEEARNAAKLAQARTLPSAAMAVVRMFNAPSVAPMSTPGDEQLVRSWIGPILLDAAAERVDQAFKRLGALAVYQALVALELPQREPIGWLTDPIERHITTLEVLDEIRRIPTFAGRQALQASLVEVMATVKACLSQLQAGREAQREENALIDAAAKTKRGARGAYSPAARLKRFLDATKLLAADNWRHPQRAALVLDSRRWARPPCLQFVAELLSDADDDEQKAAKLLVQRMHDAARRA